MVNGRFMSENIPVLCSYNGRFYCLFQWFLGLFHVCFVAHNAVGCL